MPLKAIVQLIAAVLAAITPAFLVGGEMGWPEWINVGVLVFGAVYVYLTTNLYDTGVWKYAKAFSSGAAAVGVILVSTLSGGLTVEEIAQIVIALLTPFAVAGTKVDSGMIVSATGRRARPEGV